MLAWFRELRPEERRTFWACAGGWGLDAFDVQIYSFVIPSLIALWKITNTQAGLLATSALVISAFGGWVVGMLADRMGRVRLLQITILWYAFFTFLSGFTGNFEQLLVVRGFQGFGFGGEWAAGSVLMGEVIRAKYRGTAVGTVQSAWAFGWAAAAILATLLFQLLPQDVAWRVMFFLGILPAFLVFYVRRFVPEPAIFVSARADEARRRTNPLEIFSPRLIAATARGALIAIGAQGGYYAITTWLPTFLRTQRHLTVLGTGGYLAVIILGSWIGYIASAYLSDAVGRRLNFLLFAFGSLVDRAHLHPARSLRPVDALSRLSARIFRLGHFQRHGPLPDRDLPDRAARDGPRLLLQFRARRRRLLSHPRGHAFRQHVARQRHRPVRRGGLRPGDPDRAHHAGDARARACMTGGRVILLRRRRAPLAA